MQVKVEGKVGRLACWEVWMLGGLDVEAFSCLIVWFAGSRGSKSTVPKSPGAEFIELMSKISWLFIPLGW